AELICDIDRRRRISTNSSDNGRLRPMEVSQFNTRENWLSFAPGLHIEDKTLLRNVAFIEVTVPEQEGFAAQLKDEGYLQGSGNWGLDIQLMANTVRSLSAANLSPVFAYVYDEFWYPFFKLHRLYGA